MDRVLDLFVRFTARFALRVFFRHLDVVGADRVPRHAPLVFVVNHYNSLVDPIIVLGKLPRSPRFIATATLWARPALRLFLVLGRVIPVYRQQDAAGEIQSNVATFSACYDILDNGGSIALFPEGKSHDEAELQPMKTGVARIILGTEQRHPGRGIRIVPVGLTYDAKRDFRSNAFVKVGESFDPLDNVETPDPENRAQVRALTARIGAALDTVTLSYPSWQEAHIIDRAAELFAQGVADTPGERGLADGFPVRKMFAEGYRVLKHREPARVRAVADAVAAYDDMLVAYSVRHEHVVSRYPNADVAIYVSRTVLLLLVRFPLAGLGFVMNGVPYLAARIAGSVKGARADSQATHQMLTGMFATPLTWLAWAIWAGAKWGFGWGIVALALGPVTAFAAIRFVEQRRQLFTEARAYLRLRRRHRIRDALLERRNDVYRQVAELANRYREMTTPD